MMELCKEKQGHLQNAGESETIHAFTLIKLGARLPTAFVKATAMERALWSAWKISLTHARSNAVMVILAEIA